MTPSVVSIHVAAAQLQATPSMIREAAEKLRVEPALCVNGVDCYSERDVRRIVQFIAGRRPGGHSPFIPPPML